MSQWERNCRAFLTDALSEGPMPLWRRLGGDF
jgi:hypothetical protein